MSPYIYNLTNTLIGSLGYDHLLPNFIPKLSGDPTHHIKVDLLCGAVRDMKPETLGRIMGAFEIGDVMVTRDDIFIAVTFSGDCEEFLRDIVATCLASVIVNRLLAMPTFPPYKKKR